MIEGDIHIGDRLIWAPGTDMEERLVVLDVVTGGMVQVGCLGSMVPADRQSGMVQVGYQDGSEPPFWTDPIFLRPRCIRDPNPEPPVAATTEEADRAPTEGDNSRECNCCGFTNPVGGLETYPRIGMRGRTKDLCQLCASTAAGLGYDLPSAHPNADVLAALSFIGNQVLKAIANSKG